MNILEKQPFESFPISIDFSTILKTGEVIIDHSVTCEEDIIDSTSSTDTEVIAKIKASEEGTHKITLQLETSLNNKYEDEIYIIVKDI